VSLDPARARLPECPTCGYGVDENDAETPYTIVKAEYFHVKCLDADDPEHRQALDDATGVRA
jgi:hypothetical protein